MIKRLMQRLKKKHTDNRNSLSTSTDGEIFGFDWTSKIVKINYSFRKSMNSFFGTNSKEQAHTNAHTTFCSALTSTCDTCSMHFHTIAYN